MILAIAPGLTARAAEANPYFPPAGGEWETVAPQETGWDADKLDAALKFAEARNSSGVVVLLKGRLLAERNWDLKGKKGVSPRYFASVRGRDAGGRVIEDVASCQKSVVSVLVGAARERGLIQIRKPASEYLGQGWSKASPGRGGASAANSASVHSRSRWAIPAR